MHSFITEQMRREMRTGACSLGKRLSYLPGQDLPDLNWDEVIDLAKCHKPTVVTMIEGLLLREESVSVQSIGPQLCHV